MKHLFPCLLVTFTLLFLSVRSSQADATARSVYQIAATSTVLIVGESKKTWCKGTGFVYQTPTGAVIVTAKHVVEDSKLKYTVTIFTGKKLKVSSVTPSKTSDLALVTVSGDLSDIPGLKIAPSDALIGDTIYSVGFPEMHTNLTLGVGLVSQYCDTMVPGVHLMGCCQINHGNSGGPLLNEFGQVIGLADCSEVDADNLCYGLPVSTIRAMLLDAHKIESAPPPLSLKKVLLSKGYLGLCLNTKLDRDDRLTVAYNPHTKSSWVLLRHTF